jgi:hypothetical protein
VSLGVLRVGAREIILGMNGTGKTRYAERLSALAWRAVFFSPVPDFAKPGRLFVTISYLEQWPGLLDDPHARIAIDVQADTQEGIAAELRRLVRLLREATKRKDSPGGFVVVLDEVGDYVRAAEEIIKSLFRRCRHNGFAVVLISQVATDIPYRCRKLATRVNTFGQEHEGELRELASIYGQSYADAVRAWTPGTGPVIWRSRTFAGRWNEAA